MSETITSFEDMTEEDNHQDDIEEADDNDISLFEFKEEEELMNEDTNKQDEVEEQDGQHFGLANDLELTFNKNKNLLMDPNVWIVDSGASNHMTPHKDGMIGAKTITSEATWGNGTKDKTVLRGNIKGMMCNRKGLPVKKGIITGVDYIPRSTFNLFSVSKLLLDIYEMNGNSNGINLVKGSIKIVFDIGIHTSQGISYCMYFTCDTEVSGVSLSKKRPTQFILHMQTWDILVKN